MLNKLGHKPLETAVSTMPYVASGSIILDNLIGGSKTQDGKGQVCPGYPRRKITEIYGPESSGKTTVALAAAAKVQRDGGSVMFIDFEHSLHHGYAKQIGVRFDDTFILLTPNTMEDGFKDLYVGIATGVDLIIVDSVAAMVPKDELEKKIDDVAKIGAVAKKMSETLPKFVHWLAMHPQEGSGESKKPKKDAPGTALILLNQERATISSGGGHGAPEPNTAGGKALKYYAYVRLRLAKYSTESVERKDPMSGKKRKFPYGSITSVKVVKAKADAKQGFSANIFIRYGYGLDDAYSVIESGVATGVLKREGAYYSYNNERFPGRDKFRSMLLTNPNVFAEVKAKVAEAIISLAPAAIPDEDVSDEDEILADLSEAFGDDDPSDKETGEPQDTVVEADDAEEPSADPEAE
jgi:recombination protein RecA